MLGSRTEEFCERWCAILNKCSMDLMTLLVDQLKKDLKDLDNEYEEKLDNLRTSLPGDKLTDTLNACQDQQHKLTQQLKELKIKKFTQDKKEKQEGRVYFWRTPDHGPIRWHFRERRQQRVLSSDQTSLSSSTTSSSSFLSVSRCRLDRQKQQKESEYHGSDLERRPTNRGPWTRSRMMTRK